MLLSFAVDRANFVPLLRLISGTLSIYFARTQNSPGAIIAWHDGPVTRATSGRSEFQNLMRVRMASPEDLVSYVVAPAFILLSLGGFSGWFYPGALAIIMAGVLHLAYNNIYGVDENGTYAGLSLSYSPVVVSAVFLTRNWLDPNEFSAILYATIVMLASLHVGPIRMPKAGRHMQIVTTYVIIWTAIYSYTLWTR